MQQRAVDLNDGIAMVVTDLHGAGDVYRRLRDCFLEGLNAGSIDRLVICGDLIHSEGPEEEDESLDMLVDVMRLQAEYGRDRVVLLCGNHEMPHIYGTTLAKGAVEYTPRFEHALVRYARQDDALYSVEDVIEFLTDLPFYARTQAGVLLTHAGATEAVTSIERMAYLLDFDHRAFREHLDDVVREYSPYYLRTECKHYFGRPYFELVQRYLAVTSLDDPRYDHFLRNIFLGQEEDFNLLWNVLFTRNEFASDVRTYGLITQKFLEFISELSPHEQRVLVAGHIAVKNGYTFVHDRHLRMASYAHAKPPKSARYLLLDCAEPVYSVAELEPHLRRVFED